MLSESQKNYHGPTSFLKHILYIYILCPHRSIMTQVKDERENVGRNMQHRAASPWNGSVPLDKRPNRPHQVWLIRQIGTAFASLIDGFICVSHEAEEMMVLLRRSWKDLTQMKVTGARTDGRVLGWLLFDEWRGGTKEIKVSVGTGYEYVWGQRAFVSIIWWHIRKVLWLLNVCSMLLNWQKFTLYLNLQSFQSYPPHPLQIKGSKSVFPALNDNTCTKALYWTLENGYSFLLTDK